MFAEQESGYTVHAVESPSAGLPTISESVVQEEQHRAGRGGRAVRCNYRGDATIDRVNGPGI